MTAFAHATFLRAAARVADLPPPGPPEIAFAGRSNVGKSSAINALVGRRALARTSKTPGRTQTINFYALGETARLVDLPGYGYARVPQSMRAQWRELVGAYLHSATTLVGIVVVLAMLVGLLAAQNLVEARVEQRSATGSLTSHSPA